MKKKTIVTIVLGAAIVTAVAYAVTKISRLEPADCDECCGDCENCSGESCGETTDEEIKEDFDKEQVEHRRLQ